MSEGLLELATLRGTVYTVAMDEVKFMIFGENGLNSIGTKDLNGCSVVMIVSIYGAIVAHIPPNSLDNSPDLDSSDRHAQKRMLEVEDLYRANASYFPKEGNNWVLCAVIQGEVALPTHQTIMQESFNRLGLTYSSSNYAAGRKSRGLSSTGTVFIDKTGQVPLVYIEDICVSEGALWFPSSSSALYSATGPTYTEEFPTGTGDFTKKEPFQYTTELGTPNEDQTGTDKGKEPEQAAATSPYYYVQNSQYFYHNGESSVALSERPKNVWVYKENGWSESKNGEQWRIWDGKKKVQYSS